jgi:hypothetical protein
MSSKAAEEPKTPVQTKSQGADEKKQENIAEGPIDDDQVE